MNLNREDVERIAENLLSGLRLEVEGEPYYTAERTVKLMLGDKEITRVTFDVRSPKDRDADY